MLQILMEQKKPKNFSITIPVDKLRKYFPNSYTPARMEETTFKLRSLGSGNGSETRAKIEH